MSAHRRYGGATLAAIVLMAATWCPVAAHIAKIPSSVSLTAGPGYFHGKVRSPAAACRSDRSIKLFKAVAGLDPLLKSTTSNKVGEWAIFRANEAATFYVKVPARTIRSGGHEHTCKATRSLSVTVPRTVTPRDSSGWDIEYFDGVQFKQNPGTAAPLYSGPITVVGPSKPPLGSGSLQLTDQEQSPSPSSLSVSRWSGLGQLPLSDLKAIGFSSYVPQYALPPTVHLVVAPAGEGSSPEEITFTPPASAVVADEWQKWTAGSSATWDTPGGEMTLSDYKAAHPSAQITDSGGLFFESYCPDNAGTLVHYMDAVTIRLSGSSLAFDFEP
jgi:hypothetical protein